MKALRVSFDAGMVIAAALRLSGWLLVNTLCAIGVLGAVAFAIGSFSLSGMMLQLANLSTRFVAADAARQGQFTGLVVGGFVLSFAITALLRRSSALAALRYEKGTN